MEKKWKFEFSLFPNSLTFQNPPCVVRNFCPSLGWTISNFGTRFDKGLGCAKSDGEPWTSSSCMGLMV
jgi:hypothetical protein